MDFWLFFLRYLPCEGYIILLMFFCALYLIFISPLLFKLWIIPKIENRYKGVTLIFDNPAYLYVPFSNWMSPQGEISAYILCKYFRFNLPIVNNSHTALRKISYDIKSADKSEMIMSFITLFAYLCLIISGIMVAFIIKK